MTGALLSSHLARLARERALIAGAAAGAIAILIVAIAAGGGSEAATRDDLRAGSASVMLLGGLIVALGLGAGTVSADAARGHLGLLAAAGAGRTRLAAVQLGSRVGAAAAVLALWTLVTQAASLALGLGLDGPFLVHALALGETLLLAFVAAAATATLFGPAISALVGAVTFVLAQAIVNLKAAADQGLIGTADSGIDAFHVVLPRAIQSPMISELQARDAAGPAAPLLDINGNVVAVPAAGWPSVVWTLVWCGVLTALVVAGARRRPI